MSNLGYQNHVLTVDNIDLTVVAKDASLLKGRDGTANYLTSNAVEVGPRRAATRSSSRPAPASTCSTTASTPTWTTAGAPATAA